MKIKNLKIRLPNRSGENGNNFEFSPTSIPSNRKAISTISNDYPYDDRTSFIPIYTRQNLSSWEIQGKAFWTVEDGEFVGRQDASEPKDSWSFF